MIRRLYSILFSTDRPMERQMFVMGFIAVSLGLLSAFFITVFGHLSPILAVAAVVSLVLTTAAGVYSLKTRNYTFGNIVFVIFAIYITFPIGILVGGGTNGGVPLWFVIAIVYIAMVFEGRTFFVLLAIGLAIFTGTAYFSFMHPELFQIEITESFRFAHVTSSVVGLSVLIGLLIRYQNIRYKLENRLAHEQRDEIKALSDAQSRFFSSMSHEIRTPLNTIIGLNEMILRDNTLSAEVTENAMTIQNASRILLSLINDVLDLSKIESGRMEVTPVQYETNHMLSDIVNLLWTRAKEKGLRFELNVGENIPSMLYGDEMRLKQVIINVLTNAIKYTNEGTVTLSVDGEPTATNEFTLRVDVDDTGIGIRKEQIPYLFDAFKRVDNERNRNVEGTGLGLAISKQLLDLMGGSITVDSIYTKGSSFHIEVKQGIVDASPMSYSSVGEVAKPDTYQNVFEAPEAHVLIVDDNDMNRMVARKLLRATRVHADVAASGEECLAKTREVHYDVIFMDHEMPEMDGIETLHALRSQESGLCRNTPVVALTANAGSDRNAFYVNHGFSAYLAKPIHGSLLEATLLQFLPSELVERTQAVPEGEAISVSASRRKRPIAITVDSVCDVPRDLLEEHGIAIIPYYVITEGGRFRDTVEIDSDNLFAYMADGTKKVETEPGTMEEYESFFASVLVDAEAVVHLCASAGVNKGYETACAAAASFGNVHVVDTGQVSSGLGIMALEAAKALDDGAGINEIVQVVQDIGERVVSIAYVPSLGNVVMTRRVARPLQLLANALNQASAFRIRKGKIRFRSLHSGYVSGAERSFVNSVLRHTGKADTQVIYVTYSGCTTEEQNELVEMVRAHSKFEEVVLQKASAAVACNTGAHSFGLVYLNRG